MGVFTKKLEVSSKPEITLIDITDEVEKGLVESGFKNGTVTLHAYRSTCGITTIEYEPGLIGDFSKLMQRLVPIEIEYGHELRWHDGNGHSHVRSSLIGTSQTFNYIDGKLQIYPWQQIIFTDFAPEGDNKEYTMVYIGE